MDHQFLEFWGNYLLTVAQGQRHIEDAAKWIQKGFKGSEDLTAMFAKFYGLDQKPKDSREKSTSWNQAIDDFQHSLAGWMRTMGWVPADAHRKIEKKVGALENEVRAKNETIRHLQNLLNKEGNPHIDVVLGFAELAQKQSREFQDIMNKMGDALNADEPAGNTNAEGKKDA